MPRISVLMPTHNRADVVGLAIASVLAQTETDFELLVVGDGCTDGTADVVQGFDDPRIRWFDLPKAPYFGYANRNVALKEAKGELIGFAAHDDLLFPDHLELLAQAISDTDADWIYSRPLWVSTDGVIVPFCTNLENEDELEVFLDRRNSIPANCVLHRASCFEKVGYWPEDVERAADWVLWCRIIEAGNRERFSYLRVPTSLHFSAVWKKSRFSSMPEVKTMLEFAEETDWWPPVLRHDVPEGSSEQEAVWRSISEGGAQWSEAVRAACATVVERLAWSAVQNLKPQARARAEELAGLKVSHAQSQKHLAEVREEAEIARSEAAALGTELERLRDTLTWKLTRGIGKLFRGGG